MKNLKQGLHFRFPIKAAETGRCRFATKRTGIGYAISDRTFELGRSPTAQVIDHISSSVLRVATSGSG
jgi:hypothetical protein